MAASPTQELSETEYQAKVLEAITTLKADLPSLFEEDISYHIYNKDIFFQDPVNTFKGKFNYRIIFWTLRFHASLFFTNIFFDVHEIAQIAPQMVKVDWTVRGTLRLPWPAKVFFNGNSHYHFNEQGLIYRHVDTWDREPQAVLRQFLPPRWQRDEQE